MHSELVDTITEKIKGLPEEEQREVLALVEKKLASKEKTSDHRPIWEVAAEISASIPLEEWEKLPSDGSVNHDHYLYGAPKRY